MDKNAEILQKIRLNKRKKLASLRIKINTVFLFGIFFTMLVFGILFFLIHKKEISEAEQRKLASFPEISFHSLWTAALPPALISIIPITSSCAINS